MNAERLYVKLQYLHSCTCQRWSRDKTLFIFIFIHNQFEINHSACRNKDCE